MTTKRRIAVLGLVGALVMALLAVTGPAQATGSSERTYRVTVENLTEGQLLTPTVAATHERWFQLFRPGHPASNGVQQLAENGGVPVLVGELGANEKVGDVAVIGAAPIAPGDSASALITSSSSNRRLSLAGMLICTNDGFAGLSSIRLPGAYGREKVVHGRAYDAGTEMNTEVYADLVVPCDGLGQTFDTNPLLAENGVVHRHAGIQGGADLVPAVHGWDDPVVKVTIERVRTFEVTVENLTSGQLLTPTVLATHARRNGIFRPGRDASDGLQQLAENGGVPVFVAELEARRAIGTVAVIGAGPIAPGSSATATVVTSDLLPKASLAGMLICTNDGFGGVNSMRLPRWIGQTRTVTGAAYDAGTEMNTEDYADLVVPCDGLGQTFDTNPLLAENGVVHRHAGIQGGADLVPAVHGWDDPVVRVTITRTG